MTIRKNKVKIPESTILLISVIVAVLIHVKRMLELFNIVPKPNPEFVEATPLDLLLRFSVLVVYAWLILKFNLTWRDRLFENSKKAVELIVGMIINLFIAVSNFFIFVHSYYLFFGIKIPQLEQSGAAFGWFLVLVALLLASFIMKLQLKSRVDAVEREELKKEKIKSELMAIKNKINPHFLFNSLNTLNSVIRNSPESATDFVDKLSYMYRYILQSSEKGLVMLTEELEFLNSYVYLIKIRYGNRFNINIDLDLDVGTIEVPVLSLQILVENAVKHNEISERNPLRIMVYNDNEYIIIENGIQPRDSLELSTGNGLISLTRQYELLKSSGIKIYKDSNFIVKLPIA